jgi:hypothetical protein
MVGDEAGLPAASAAIAFAGAFGFRVAALYLGRKLHHRSAEELRVLGLAVDDPEDR